MAFIGTALKLAGRFGSKVVNAIKNRPNIPPATLKGGVPVSTQIGQKAGAIFQRVKGVVTANPFTQGTKAVAGRVLGRAFLFGTGAEAFAYQYAKQTGQPYKPVSTLGGIASYGISPVGALFGTIAGTFATGIKKGQETLQNNPLVVPSSMTPTNNRTAQDILSEFARKQIPDGNINFSNYAGLPQSPSVTFGGSINPSVSTGGGIDYSMLALLLGGALGGAYLLGRKKRRKKKKSKKGKRHNK